MSDNGTTVLEGNLDVVPVPFRHCKSRTPASFLLRLSSLKPLTPDTNLNFLISSSLKICN